MYKNFRLLLWRKELFYHDLQLTGHNSDQIAEFLNNLVLKSCIIIMLPGHCNMIKAIIPAVCVTFGQLIMTSFTKQFTAPQILSLMNL